MKEHFVQVPEMSRWSDAIERMRGTEPTQEFVPFGEEVLARRMSSEPLNRMNPRYKFGVWLRVRNNSAECFVETAEGGFRAREIRRIERQNRWDKEAINNVIGVPWRLADGKWTVDRPVTQIDPLPPPPPVPFEGARVQRERITRTDIEAFYMRSDLESEHKLTQIPATSESRNVSSVWIEEARCRMRDSQRKLRETSEEERKSKVQQESWQHHRS